MPVRPLKNAICFHANGVTLLFSACASHLSARAHEQADADRRHCSVLHASFLGIGALPCISSVFTSLPGIPLITGLLCMWREEGGIAAMLAPRSREITRCFGLKAGLRIEADDSYRFGRSCRRAWAGCKRFGYSAIATLVRKNNLRKGVVYSPG